jgi:adhesin transport system membrane fusion protein
MQTPRTLRMLLFATLAMLFCGLIWAGFAILDEVKRGNGRVIPSQQMQIVQSLEGGLVETIAVHEGQIVNKGQLLIRIDDTTFSAQLGEVRERRDALAARVARLDAESHGADKLVFPRNGNKPLTRAE